jgi:LysM repeat protein
MRAVIVAAVAVLLVSAVGCEFASSTRKKQEAATTAEISSMRDEVARLRTDLDSLEGELSRSNDALRLEVQALTRALNDLEAKADRRIADATKELAAKINEIEQKRVSDKNALNAKMDAIVTQVQKALGGSGGGATGTHTVRGIEHTVKEGETVSAIAAAYRNQYGDKYDATVKAILDANNLTPNSIIRPGDKLLIPLKE